MDYLVCFLGGCAFTLLCVYLFVPTTPVQEDAQPDTRQHEVVTTIFQEQQPNHFVRITDAPVPPQALLDVCKALERNAYKYTHAQMTGKGRPLSRAQFTSLGHWFIRRHLMRRDNATGTYSPTEGGKSAISTLAARTHTPARGRG